MCIKERGADPEAVLPPSLLYFAGGYVETSYGGQAGQAVLSPSLLYFAGGYVETSYGGQAGQALSGIEGAYQKAKRRTR